MYFLIILEANSEVQEQCQLVWFLRRMLAIEHFILDFPGGPVVKNPPANAGFDPGSGEIPHAAEQLSP